MIKDIKDLEKLLKLCRKQGVTEIEFGGAKLKLGDVPYEQQRNSEVSHDPVNPYSNFPTGDLSPEQLMFYSAGGLPEDDPYLKRDDN